MTVVLISAACGARDSSAQPTTVGAPSSTAEPTTTTVGEPIARFAGFSSPLYSKGDNWLCGPEVATKDRCLIGNQDTTVVEADGRRQVRFSEPPPRPTFDCFFVHTATGPGTTDLLLARNTTAQDDLVFEQAARLRELCRVYAPLYREDGAPGGEGIAYTDVHDAFKHYMARWNGGRHVLLFGHGAGADHLARLLEELFDDDAQLRRLLVSAFLIDGNVEVAAGSGQVGQLQHIRSCASPAETGCVVGYTVSSPSARTAAAAPAGRTRLCTNPASLAGGRAPLTAIVEHRDEYLRARPGIETPFVELPGVVIAECVSAGGATTLEVSPAASAAADARDGAALVAPDPDGTLHRRAVPLALGSIMELIGQQAAPLT